MRMIQNHFFHRPQAAPESSRKPLTTLAAASFGTGTDTAEYMAMGLLPGVASDLELPWMGAASAIVALLSYGMEHQGHCTEANALAAPRSFR